jgi:hypothetical protein
MRCSNIDCYCRIIEMLAFAIVINQSHASCVAAAVLSKRCHEADSALGLGGHLVAVGEGVGTLLLDSTVE